MSRSKFLACILGALFVTMVAGDIWADELTLTVQQQLHTQGAYSGPIDGKPGADLTRALKNYQQQHHLPATGVLDRATAKALDDENGLALPESSATPPAKQKTPSSAGTAAPIATATPPSPAASAPPKPTSPPPIPSASPAASAATTPSATPNESPSPMEESSPAEVSPSPPGEGPLSSERVTRFLRSYFDAGEGKSVSEQLRFYSFPVNYFGHGKVSSQFVRNEILRTMRRWPRRSYRIRSDVTVTPLSKETATAEFTVSYTLQRGKQRVSGRKNDRVTLRETKGGLKIVAIREQRG